MFGVLKRAAPHPGSGGSASDGFEYGVNSMDTRHLVRLLVLLVTIAVFPLASHADAFQWGISVGFPPPPLPLYVQPPCPEPGYIWTPGYWAYDDDADDYFWVPGTWVYAPQPGLLWTPGYWSEGDGDEYVWHQGYWAPDVGYYGGIDYGYGYFGVGFVGGYWRDRDFYYNRAFANVVNIRVTNLYVNDRDERYRGDRDRGDRTSFNGREGVHARPTAPELRAEHEPHRGWTNSQQSHAWQARSTPGLLASSNHGRPPVAATERPGVFAGRGIVAARPSTPPLPATWRGFRNGGVTPHGSAPAADARAPGMPVRTDRPAWSMPGGGAGPEVRRSLPGPVSNEPAYRNADPRSSVRSWSPPSEGGPHESGRPQFQSRPNVESAPNAGNRPYPESWHAPSANPGRAYGPPPAPPPHIIESRAPQGFAAPHPRPPEAHPAPPPEHARKDGAREDGRPR